MLNRFLVNLISFGKWYPFGLVDKDIGKSCDLIFIGNKPQINVDVVSSQGACWEVVVGLISGDFGAVGVQKVVVAIEALATLNAVF